MATVTHLNKAPIQEAVFDFRVKLPSSISPDVFLNLNREALPDYPLVEPHRSIISGFRLIEGKPIVGKTQDRKDGYVYKTSDEKNIAQFRENGFTFSRLSPYTDWDTVKKEAKKLWEVYCSITKPESVTRIALRYINRLDLALPVKMEDFFIRPPSVPESISQEIVGYTVRFVIKREDLMANIIQTTVDLTDKTRIGIIFDIDAYFMDDNGISKDLWDTFEKLREFKNIIFFNSITEKTVEIYKC